MNHLTQKCLQRSRFNLTLFIAAVSAISVITAIFMGCGSGGGIPGKPPEPPSLGVVITSIETDECPNVNVKVSITDENNLLIEDDPALIVKLYEDGLEQTDNFTVEWLGGTPSPITVVFVMDYSSSMDNSLEDMQNGVKAFIDAMKAGDRAAVIKFNQTPQLMVGLTSDKVALYNAVDEQPDEGIDTNIYDAVFDSVGILAGVEGPCAVILFTDGKHDPGNSPVQHTLNEAVDYAIQQDVKVFAIAYDLRDDSEIRYISEETGGIYHEIMDPSTINDVYLELYELLDKQRLIVYTSSAIDGVEHSIQVVAEYNGITGESTIQNYTSCTMP